MQIRTTIIKFSEIKLATRDAHKLRGYFSKLFKEHSTILHNHLDSGESNYRYPLVQYKVIKNVPMLVGINEGGKLLTSLFLKISELDINGQIYPVYHKNIENRINEIDVADDLFQYNFETLWLGLNQKNFRIYSKASQEEKNKLLKKTLVGNILSFFKGIGYFTGNKIMLTANLSEKETKFKDKIMVAFSGNFVCNAILPDYVGLGKSVSRGFGCIIKK
ncbi:MAG: CRISPR-associated endonuclease Cas6 [Bacteroidetes bacterium]|nr:CRISPR-associated endonuclease Cas6 [Bacteroidota bacterium]